MALFPAYGLVDCQSPVLLDKDLEAVNVSREVEEQLLKSESSDDDVVEPPPKKPNIEKHIDFFIDKSRDRANVQVSTLYPPGRPIYKYKTCTNANTKKSKKEKRYFEVNMKKHNEKCYDVNDSDQSKHLEPFGNFEKVGAKGEMFNDDRYEKVILEKTAEYNKAIRENPHNIELWLKFVDFQEERLSFDILQSKAVSESSARDVCATKQLAILDSALQRNDSNEDLLRKKFEIIKLRRPSNEYIAAIKGEMRECDSEFLWSELISAVQTISSMCNESAVRQVFVAALKEYASDQDVIVRLMYRYCVFLRQAGLWEQLLMFLDLTCTMNLTETELFNVRTSKEKEDELFQEEDKIISSGLPLHAVWCRIEKLRSGFLWRRPNSSGTSGTEDPQRYVEPALVAEIIRPITKPQPRFAMAVNILRLMKVPLPDQTSSLLKCLDGHRNTIMDCENVESILPLLCGKPFVANEARLLIAALCDRPNYFTDQDGYLTFIEQLFHECSMWFDGKERLAFQVWYIKFNEILLSLNSSHSEAKRIRASVQNLLKKNRDSPVLFCEFAKIESLTTTKERALHVLQMAVHACKNTDKSWLPYACVSQIDFLNDSNATANEILNTILACYGCSKDDVLALCEKFFGSCNGIVKAAASDATKPDLVDFLLPSGQSATIQIYLELVCFLKSPKEALGEFQRIENSLRKNKTTKSTKLHEEMASRVVKRSGFGLWVHSFNKVEYYVNMFPRNIVIASKFMDMSFNYKPICLSLEAFCASLLGELGRNSSERRILNKLRRVTECDNYAYFRSSPLIWRLRFEYESKCGNISNTLYKALDECPSVKSLYLCGCWHSGSSLSDVTDLIIERGLRLHALPDELTP